MLKSPKTKVVHHPKFGICPTEVAVLESVYRTLIQLNHPAIVQLIDYFSDDHFYYLVTELNGRVNYPIRKPALPITSVNSLQSQPPIDLFQFIISRGKLPETLVKHIFSQIVTGVKYLYDKGYVHGDVKDENVLIDDSFTVKLIDFGSASKFDDKNVSEDNSDEGYYSDHNPASSKSFMGTLEYAPPEYAYGRYDKLSGEIWALGCLLYVLLKGMVISKLTLQIPFNDQYETLHKAYKPIGVCYSLQVKKLVAEMLQKNQGKRLRLTDLFVHPWITSSIELHDI